MFRGIDLLALLSVRIHELTDEGNRHHTPPSASVHRMDRGEFVTEHEHLARNLELALVLKQTSRLHDILAGELLHTRRIERLAVIGLRHVDEAAIADGHNIWIRRT